MAEYRIKMTLFVILLLQFTAVTGQTDPSVTVRAGDEVTLPCNNVIKDQDKCDGTTWIASYDGKTTTVELINLGKISNNLLDKDKSDRLNVTENCSLVIRKITREDVGRYTCRQFRSGQQQGPDATVYLSVVFMTGDKGNDEVALFCSVLTYKGCRYTVKWLYEGNKNDVETTQLSCSARVTFPTLHLNQKSNYYELLKCSVTDETSGETLLFNASPQFSCEKTGGCTSAGKNDTSSEKNDTPTTQGRLWLYILVAVGLAVLFAAVIVVVVIRRKRTKGNQTQMDKNMRLTSNPAVTPEINDNTADPEDGVSYASVSYTKKTNSKAKVRGKGDDDGGEAVTYSTVKASSSSPSAAGASADLSDLYATVKKTDK